MIKTHKSKRLCQWIGKTTVITVCVVFLGLWNLFIGYRGFETRRETTVQGSTTNHRSLPLAARDPTHAACSKSDGLYHVSIADIGGGVGTAFFQLILVQLQYAEWHNLTPWVHLKLGVSNVTEDEAHRHGKVTIRALSGYNVTRHRNGRHFRDIVPGPVAQVSKTETKDTYEICGHWDMDPLF